MAGILGSLLVLAILGSLGFGLMTIAPIREIAGIGAERPGSMQ